MTATVSSIGAASDAGAASEAGEAGAAGTAGAAGMVAGGDGLRAVMRHHAKGVAVVTAGTGRPAGFCVTSLTSISLDPALVSFTVGVRSASWPVVAAADHVVVHLLAEDQTAVACAFAHGGEAKFGTGTRWSRGPGGLPVLDGVLAWMLVEPLDRRIVADHALVIGAVRATRDGTGGRPLIHHAGTFTGVRS